MVVANSRRAVALEESQSPRRLSVWVLLCAGRAMAEKVRAISSVSGAEMTRATYRKCKVCGEFHDVDNWPDNHREGIPDNRNYDLAAPAVISDNLPDVQGQHDGKRYSSKRALRQSYRDHGVTEVGNESPILTKPKVDTRAEAKAAVQKAASQVRLKTKTETAKQVRGRERARARGRSEYKGAKV
ncbi:MAG: hypothetical protein AAFW60_10760 [Pseudomonadota bacterium]